MAKKRAFIGFSNVYLAPLLTDTEAKYETSAGTNYPYAGKLSRSAKESKTEIFYDDELYADINEILGLEVEITFAEMPVERLVSLGYGEVKNGILEAPLTIPPKDYSLRCQANTISQLPTYLKWRKLTINSVQVGELQTKGSGVSVAEVSVKGFISHPRKDDVMPHAILEMKEDKSNALECQNFLKNAEVLE